MRGYTRLENMANRLYKTKMKKHGSQKDPNSLESIKARHQTNKENALAKMNDILVGSYLIQAKPTISDIIKYTGVGQLSKRTGGQRLPQNTANSMYEHLLLDRFENL